MNTTTPTSSPGLDVDERDVSTAVGPSGPVDPPAFSAEDRRRVLWWVEAVALAGVVAAVAGVAISVRRDGHWWGDDWALYLRQAEGLLDGTVGRVAADNRFTVETSGLPEFTPPMYPWGFPLLLAPFVALLGTDLDRLAIAQVVFFAWFLVMWHRLARPRTGPTLALIGVAVIGLSPQYLRWTEYLQSELAFLAVATTALVVLDRRRTRESLVAAGTSLWPLVGAGVAAAAAFSVRREGLAVVAAIGVAQLAALAGAWHAGRPIPVAPTLRDGTAARLLGRLAVPHLAALGTVVALQVLLPSTLVPRYRGTGVHNVWGFASDHLGHVMETLGLKQVVVDTPTVLGNDLLGAVAVAVFVVAVLVGIVIAAARRPAADLPLAAFLVVAMLIGGSFRFPGSRYIAAVGPIALIFALLALRAVAARLGGTGRRRHLTAAVAVALVVPLVAANAARANQLIDDVADLRDVEYVQWGPEHPVAIEMFAAVRSRTAPDDVIGFFKARAMTQRTDRRAVQLDQWHPLQRTEGALTHVVVERTDPVFTELRERARPALVVWANTRFVLLRLDDDPGGAPAPPAARPTS